MDNEREIEVQAPRSLHTLATGSCVDRSDRPDVRPVEQVVLDPNDRVVGLVWPAGFRVEDTDPPWPEPPVEPAPGEDRHRRTTRVEADAARVEQLHPARCPQVELPARFEEELALFGEEEGKSREIDDLLVGFYLREVGADRDVRGQGRSDAELGVDPALAAEIAARCLPADAVVLRLYGPTKRIWIELEIVGTVQIPEIGDRALIVQAVEPLRPTVPAPQVFLVLASNEAPDIEPELRIGPGVKPQREQRDAELGRPSGTIARDGDLPDTIPVLVQVVDARELRVPQGAVRIRGEHEGAPAVVEAVDEELDVVVARKIGVPAELAGPHAAHGGVVAAHDDVESAGVMRHLDDRPLRGGGRLEWFALAEVVDRVCCRPKRLVQPAIERHRRPAQRRSNRRRARSPASRGILVTLLHATQYADPRERDADVRPHHMPLSTSPTIPAARINTGSGIFLGTSRSTKVTSAMRIVGPSVSARRPSITAAPAMAPVAAAVTPSTNAFTCRFLATRWKWGAKSTVMRYTGRKTPIAARIAPASPATR